MLKKLFYLCMTFLLVDLSAPALSFEVPEALVYSEAEEAPPPPEHKEEISYYIEKFCHNKGRANVRIQNGIIVDCMTANTLWKIDYADNWPNSLVKSLAYPIYDDYRGEEEFAPKPGIALIQEDSDDYKNMIQLQQLVKYHNLPISLDTIENYATAKAKPNVNEKIHSIKNFLIDLSN